jgi:hypothetical protein
MGHRARGHATGFGWDSVLDDLMGGLVGPIGPIGTSAGGRRAPSVATPGVEDLVKADQKAHRSIPVYT